MRDSSVRYLGDWPGHRLSLVTGPHDLATGPHELATGPHEVATGPHGPEAQAEPKLSVRFVANTAGDNPLAVLLINRAEKAYQMTYPMTRNEAHDQVQDTVTEIQRRYKEQAAATATLEQPDAPDDLGPQDRKEHKPLFVGQVTELLGYQEALEIAATLDEATRPGASQTKKQAELLDKLNSWYADGLGMIREEVRNHSGGLGFVRELLRSGKELLVDLGVRLAREPSIRPALQRDLLSVFQNSSLPPQIRQRAFSYMRAEVRQDATTAGPGE